MNTFGREMLVEAEQLPSETEIAAWSTAARVYGDQTREFHLGAEGALFCTMSISASVGSSSNVYVGVVLERWDNGWQYEDHTSSEYTDPTPFASSVVGGKYRMRAFVEGPVDEVGPFSGRLWVEIIPRIELE
jgi:hypothetical protein